jgi:TetR/AcrR family transcriptional repressor of nem operon
MRYDAEHKQRTHERVVKAAAKAIRAKGPDRVGVADVMADVGLTHGGFYAHFDSKDALIAAAIGQMFEEARARLELETSGNSPRKALTNYIDFYLSPAHRDARRSGCPIAALSSDMPRLNAKVRSQFSAGRARLCGILADLIRQTGRQDAESEADSMYAELLGALSIARMEPDSSRSDAILERSRRAIKRRLGLAGN